jgi:hypothetical protein
VLDGTWRQVGIETHRDVRPNEDDQIDDLLRNYSCVVVLVRAEEAFFSYVAFASRRHALMRGSPVEVGRAGECSIGAVVRCLF